MMVHLGILGKEGKLEFSQLVEDGMGVEHILLLGVEPQRVRVWAVKPESVRSFPSYGQQARGLHHCTIDPEDPPSWARLVETWE